MFFYVLFYVTIPIIFVEKKMEFFPFVITNQLGRMKKMGFFSFLISSMPLTTEILKSNSKKSSGIDGKLHNDVKIGDALYCLVTETNTLKQTLFAESFDEDFDDKIEATPIVRSRWIVANNPPIVCNTARQEYLVNLWTVALKSFFAGATSFVWIGDEETVNTIRQNITFDKRTSIDDNKKAVTFSLTMNKIPKSTELWEPYKVVDRTNVTVWSTELENSDLLDTVIFEINNFNEIYSDSTGAAGQLLYASSLFRMIVLQAEKEGVVGFNRNLPFFFKAHIAKSMEFLTQSLGCMRAANIIIIKNSNSSLTSIEKAISYMKSAMNLCNNAKVVLTNNDGADVPSELMYEFVDNICDMINRYASFYIMLWMMRMRLMPDTLVKEDLHIGFKFLIHNMPYPFNNVHMSNFMGDFLNNLVDNYKSYNLIDLTFFEQMTFRKNCLLKKKDSSSKMLTNELIEKTVHVIKNFDEPDVKIELISIETLLF